MMILDLHRQGLSITAIARRTGRDPKTVRKYIARDLEPPAYGPRQVDRPGKLAPYLDYLRERIVAFPQLTATRLTREIRERGYTGAYTAVKRFVAAIRLENAPKPFEVRFETPPGQQAQVDFARFVTEFTTSRARAGWSPPILSSKAGARPAPIPAIAREGCRERCTGRGTRRSSSVALASAWVGVRSPSIKPSASASPPREAGHDHSHHSRKHQEEPGGAEDGHALEVLDATLRRIEQSEIDAIGGPRSAPPQGGHAAREPPHRGGAHAGAAHGHQDAGRLRLRLPALAR